MTVISVSSILPAPVQFMIMIAQDWHHLRLRHLNMALKLSKGKIDEELDFIRIM
jgi:hypothetical protein